MPCLFALFTVFAPRLALLGIWLFTNLVTRAFGTFIVPLLGLIFLPFTTLIYVIVWNPASGSVSGWGWFWVILAFLIELSADSGSAYSNRRRLPQTA